MTPDFQCGDVLLVCGRSVVSTLMAKWSAEEIDAQKILADFSHVGFVIAGPPVPLLIEAVVPRVRVAPISDAVQHVDHATIMRPRFLAGREAELVAAACRTVGQVYGFTKYPGFIADAMFRSDSFSQAFALLPDYQVCSQHVGLIFSTIKYVLGEHYTGLTPNEIAAWGTRHPEEWEMRVLPT